MSAADEGRTEKATEKQRKKFRDEGSVAKSVELNTLFTFLMGLVSLSFLGGLLVNGMVRMMRQTFEQLANIQVTTQMDSISWFYVEEFLWMMTPFLVILFVGVVLINILQFGFHISWKAIKPKFTKLNAIANVKKVLFSKQSLVELVKSVAKISFISYLAWLACQPLIQEFRYMFLLTPVQIATKTWEYASDLWLMIIIFTAILGIADYTWQKYQLEDRMKMRPQDVEDETKQAMGDPQIKKEQRLRGMRMLQNLLSEKTKEADVVITNPTHFAVALQYQHGKMRAPKVVAKGVDHLAFKIRKTARQAQIPIVENRALARSLYYAADLDGEIPERLFRPVAEILAFIFKLRKERSAHG